MKLAILRIGPIEPEVVSAISKGLKNALPQLEYTLLDSIMPVPEETHNKERHQYNSTAILKKITVYGKTDIDIVLGVTLVDLYASGLNFVFGEAQCPRRTALISLFRLRPESHGRPTDKVLLHERAIKEAVHEVGHALGLGHCHDSSCGMFFSNSILDTDVKKSTFCEECSVSIKSIRESEC